MKMVLIGDSIVASLFANAVSILQAGGHTVTSLAVSGNTVANQITAWQASAVRGDSTYSVAVIQVGVNDIRTGVALATTLANFATLINDIRANNPTIKIILGLMLPARTDASVAASYSSKYLPVQAAILAAGTNLDIPAVDRIMTSANAVFNDGNDAMIAGWDSGDHLHPTAGGNRLNAVEFRANINALFNLTDPVPIGGESRNIQYQVGEWRQAPLIASQNILFSRTNSNPTSTVIRRASKVVGFTIAMQTLGDETVITAGTLTIQVIAVSWQGVDQPAVTIGTMTVGECNACKASLVEVPVDAGGSVYISCQTDAAWAPITNNPTVTLILQEN